LRCGQTLRERLDVAKRSTKTGKGSGKTAKKENAVVAYLRSTRAELRKVHWPTREQAWNLTKIVFAVTLSMAVFLGLVMDNVLTIGLQQLVAGNILAMAITGVLVIGGVVVAVILGRRAPQ
jgi:preprotein translocase subunit SecE